MAYMRSMLESSRLDQFGVVTSAACAIHCAIGPLLVGASGLLGSIVQDERVETLLALAAVVVAVMAAALGYRRHRDRWVLFLVAAGLSLLGVARFFELPPLPEPLLLIFAAAVLIGAHARNALLLHRLRSCCSRDGCAVV
jgi:hypothetical protein